MFFDLEYRDGLYYCSTNVFTVNHDPVCVSCHRASAPTPPDNKRLPSKFVPTSKARQVESKVWMFCFGSPGEHQFDALPTNANSTPTVFEHHPF
jgi:hypothetical protein